MKVLSVILYISHYYGGGPVTEVARFETMEACQAVAKSKWEPRGTYFRLACVDTRP